MKGKIYFSVDTPDDTIALNFELFFIKRLQKIKFSVERIEFTLKPHPF